MKPKPQPLSNKQIIFTAVAKHLLTQNVAALAPGKDTHKGTMRCMYRAGVLKCAIGGIIKDEFYDPAFEHRGAETVDVVRAVEKSLGINLLEGEITFLGELQNIHDDDEPEEWRSCLENIALEYGLEMPAK